MTAADDEEKCSVISATALTFSVFGTCYLLSFSSGRSMAPNAAEERETPRRRAHGAVVTTEPSNLRGPLRRSGGVRSHARVRRPAVFGGSWSRLRDRRRRLQIRGPGGAEVDERRGDVGVHLDQGGGERDRRVGPGRQAAVVGGHRLLGHLVADAGDPRDDAARAQLEQDAG